MTVVLTTRNDINLDSFRRVAWQGEGVRISEAALQRIAQCRESFLQLIDNDPELVIYGVTTAMGELATPSESSASMRLRACPVPSRTQSRVSLSVTRKPRL